MRQMQYIIKEALDKPSRARSFMKHNVDMQFCKDTWYIKDDGEVKLVSENILDFSNGRHIEMLLYYYPKLVDTSCDLNKSEMKHIL